MKLIDDTILITGGTSGIGLGLAKALAKQNTVIVAARSESTLQKVITNNPKLVGYSVDVSDFKSVQHLYEMILVDYPQLNMVINSAGIMRAVSFFDADSKLPPEIAINLNGTINVNKVFLPLLAKNQESALVNISSGLAYVTSTAHPIYSGSKAAVSALTTALSGQAAYFGYQQLHVIQVAPPLISETNLNPGMHENGAQNSLNMSLDRFVDIVLIGIMKNRAIINPGPSHLLYWVGKLVPQKLKIKIASQTMVTEFGKHKS